MKKKLLRFALLVTLSLFVCPASGAEETLTLSGLVKKVAGNSRDFKDAMLTLLKSEAAYNEKISGLFPSISLSVPSNLNLQPEIKPISGFDITIKNYFSLDLSPQLKINQYLPTSGTLSMWVSDDFAFNKAGSIDDPGHTGIYSTDTTYSNTIATGLTYTQPLFFENAYAAALTVTEETYSIAKLGLFASRNKIVYQAVSDYYSLMFSRYSLDLAESRLSDARKNYEDAGKKFDQGMISKLAYLTVEAALKKTELALIDSKTSYKNAVSVFASRYGFGNGVLVGNSVAGIPVAEEAASLSKLAEAARAKNIELAIEKKSSEIADAALVTTKCQNVPLTLNVGPQVTFDKSKTYVTDLGEAFTAPFGSSPNTKFALNATLSWNIFDAGLADAKIKAAALDAEQKKLSLSAKIDKTNQDAESLLAKIDRNKKALEYAQLNLRIAELEFQKAQSDIEHGDISKLDFSAASGKYDDSKLAVTQAGIDNALASLELAMFVGNDIADLIVRSNL